MLSAACARSPISPSNGDSPIDERPPVAALIALSESARNATGQEQWPMAQTAAQPRAVFSAASAPSLVA
eukprot:2273132-Lingulodinium_polyedra.AAC.1